eukprot:116236_1
MIFFTSMALSGLPILSLFLFLGWCNLLWVTIVITLCKMPRFYDIYNIREETNIVLAVWAFATVYFSINSAFAASTFNAQLSAYMMMVISSLYSYLLILYPIKHHFKNQQHQNDIKSDDMWTDHVNTSMEHWNGFMYFLATQFAVESLCFYSDVVQFKKKI